MAAGAPGEVPPGSKSKKVRDWLFQINKEAPEEALQILGRLLEDLFDRNIEAPWGEPNAAWVEDRERVSKQMAAHGRSEERRVGKEGVSPCRSGCWTYP